MASAPRDLVITTALGRLVLALRADAAPVTAAHIERLAAAKVFDGAATFYRQDFVIQMGLHGSGRTSPFPKLAVNESRLPSRLPNVRGAMAVAHHDTPDCGDTEIFLSLKDNAHLNDAYGGYCVFATVAAGDAESWKTSDAIVRAVAAGDKPKVLSVAVVPRA